MTTTGRRYGAQTATERHDGRRARLLDAGIEAFGTEGYAAVSIEQLCARAGVSTRNFYEHFQGREALLLALHDEINAAALAAVGEALGDVDPSNLAARAQAGVEAYFHVMTADRRRARIALVETVGVSRVAEAHRQAAIGRFAELLEFEGTRLAAQGLLPRRDYRLIAIALVGAVNGLINTWTADPDWETHVDDVIRVAARLIVVGLSE